jgi:hypothetical protein
MAACYQSADRKQPSGIGGTSRSFQLLLGGSRLTLDTKTVYDFDSVAVVTVWTASVGN